MLRIFPIVVQRVVVYVVKQLLQDVCGYKMLKKIGEIWIAWDELLMTLWDMTSLIEMAAILIAFLDFAK